jgi:hypothetical protein
MLRVIVDGADALGKSMRAGLPYDIEVRFEKSSVPGGNDRVISMHYAPGERAKPFAVMQIVGPGAVRYGGALYSMFEPTLEARLAALMEYQQVITQLREFVIDGRSMTLKELFGIDPFEGKK